MKTLQTRTNLLRLLPKNAVIAEIGVFKGEFSKEILEICEPRMLYLVDLFTGLTASGDKDGNNVVDADMDKEYERLCAVYEENYHVALLQTPSLQFLYMRWDNSLDAVYLDGDHSYETISQELALSRRRVKAGGFICGHDYVTEWGVKRAVDEFCEQEGLEIEYLTKDVYPSYCIINKK